MPEPIVQADLIIEGAAEVVTCVGARQSDVGAIAGGALACAGGRIVFVGASGDCRRSVALAPGGRRIDARGGVVLPGFVDPHTHLPFAGWRDAEFEKRLAGATYLEIAASGGGILSTVRATRESPPEALLGLLLERLDAMLLAGTTTAEAKSGYGLSLDAELRLLETIARASGHPVELVPTFLGAHVVAPEYRDGRRAENVRALVDEWIPRVAERGLARYCDVFVDQGAFTLEEGRTILEAARARGLALRVHGEQLTHTGAAALAAELGAASVDHLEHATAEDVAALAATWASPGRRPVVGGPGSASGGRAGTGAGTRGDRRGTVAVLLPGVSLFLRETARPPARALIDAGVPVALATDFNPGSSPCLAIPPILNLACVLLGMTPDEAIAAATRIAALSLGIDDRVGTLEPGKQADLVVWDVPGRRHLAYRFGPLSCRLVVKRGTIVVEDGRLAAPPPRAAVPGGKPMLVDLTVKDFLDKLASDAPTPGGGSVSALAGAQAGALLGMAIAITVKSEKYAASRAPLEPIRAKAAALQAELARLVDRDADSYDAVVAANRLPKGTDEEKAARKAARDKALLFAAEIPLKTAELATSLAALSDEAAPHINPNAASDLLVAALFAQAALGGAAANVRINIDSLKSPEFAARANQRLAAWTDEAASRVASIRARFATIG